MNDFDRGGKDRGMGQTKDAPAGQRIFAHCETRIQHGAERVLSMVPAGAAARLHQGYSERLARFAGRPQARFVSIIVRKYAIRKLAAEAADNGPLASELRSPSAASKA